MGNSDIQNNYPATRAAANEVLGLPGTRFTNTTGGHVETGISAAASLPGLSILRNKGYDVREFTPGTMVLSETDIEMNEIWNFMMAAAQNVGLDPSGGWDEEIPEANKPLSSVPELTHTTEKNFRALCGRHHLKKYFFPYVAVLAAHYYTKEQAGHLSVLSNTRLVLERTDNRKMFIKHLRKTKT